MKMYKIKAHSIISHVITVLQIFGMWHRNDESVYSRTSKKIINLTILVSLFASLASGAFLSEDMNESIYLSAATVASALMVVKLCYVLSKQKEVSEFLNEICVHSITDMKEFDEINLKLNNFAKFGYVNIFSMSIAILLFIILSLPVFASEIRLPLNVGFPLDWKTSLLSYWLAHSFVITAVVLAMVVTFFTVIYWYIMLNCSIKYEILGNKLRQIGTRTVMNISIKQNGYATDNHNINDEDLINLIKSHRSIREYKIKCAIILNK